MIVEAHSFRVSPSRGALDVVVGRHAEACAWNDTVLAHSVQKDILLGDTLHRMTVVLLPEILNGLGEKSRAYCCNEILTGPPKPESVSRDSTRRVAAAPFHHLDEAR